MNILKNKYCINLKKEVDKKKLFNKMCKKYNINNIKIFRGVYKKRNGKLGCLTSHLKLIKKAKKENMDNILIMEDDCIFISDPNKIPEFPKDYNMLYFGGNVSSLNEKYEEKKDWIRANMFTTHCYLINKNIYSILIKVIEENKDKAIDVIYKDYIHPNYNCYILNKMIAHQRTGYSNIEQRMVKYALKDAEYYKEIKEINHKIVDGNYIINGSAISDKDLPYVSILTPTYNRRKYFPIAITCFKHFIYPKDKIEWVILDDGKEDLTEILPKDSRIKYYKLKKKIGISEKRNLCVKYASHDILLHMDDDDFYKPESIISRVKSLIINKVGLVGSGIICCYDTNLRKSYLIGNNHQIAEATMCYTREFFNKRQFNEKISMGEGIKYIKNRKEEIRRLPFYFIMVAINHNNNYTQNLRTNFDKTQIDKYEYKNDMIPLNLKKYLNKI